MRILTKMVTTMALLAVPISMAAAIPDLTGIDTSKYVTIYNTLPPTPKGTKYLPGIDSGKSIQIRFEAPKKKPLSFKLDLHNIMALTGEGTIYHLQLRKDSLEGPVIYDGPITNADGFNVCHWAQIEMADRLTSADFKRGYFDVYAIGRCQGDQWTIYRDNDNDPNWDIRAVALEESPALTKALAQTALLRQKGIHLLPFPQKITTEKQDFLISSKSKILLTSKATDDDQFAAGLLQDEIKKLSGITLPIQKGYTKAGSADLVLGAGDSSPKGNEAYHLETNGKFRASANTSTGLFYAVQTTIQLLQKQNGKLFVRGAVIDDYPTLPNRMVQYDLARYQTVNLDYCKRMVREFARFKLNQLMFYMEDDFKYTKYPFTGRPNTFTPESARELVAYAKKYHVQIVPQLEAFGHAQALLSHPEFADLRENGDSWDFCTSNPRTWQVLDDMVKELTEIFDTTPYIHLGCDEFENVFAKCPACKAQVEKIGLNGLYAQHVNKLNEIAKKYDRTAIIWTSHGHRGVPGKFTIDASNLVSKDVIPMEWVYHGPREYPMVKEYADHGYKQLFVAPGVMAYGFPYPDADISLRSTRELYKASLKYGAIGGCACTWEMGYGNQIENHWYGFVYSAQCAWNVNQADEYAYDHAFANHWLGLTKPADIALIRQVFRLQTADQETWGNLAGSNSFIWARFDKIKKRAGICWESTVAAAPSVVKNSEEALNKIKSLKSRSDRNQISLETTAQAIRLIRASGRKVLAIDSAGKAYQEALDAQKQGRSDISQILGRCIAILEPLRADYPPIVADLKQAQNERGGCTWDAGNMESLSTSLDGMINKLTELRDSSQIDPAKPLPAADELGL